MRERERVVKGETIMAESFSDVNNVHEAFHSDGCPCFYEPQCTDEELLQIEERERGAKNRERDFPFSEICCQTLSKDPE